MVQNVVFVADDDVEQPFVGGSAQFFKRPEIRRDEVAARTATDGRLYALSVGFPRVSRGVAKFSPNSHRMRCVAARRAAWCSTTPHRDASSVRKNLKTLAGSISFNS